MDLPESTKVLYNRIKKLEPENVSKILGYLLIQESSEHDMILLAFCPDTLLKSLISKAKNDLKLFPNAPIYYPFSANNSNFAYSTSVPNLSIEDKSDVSASDLSSNYYPTDHIIGPRANRRSSSLPEFPNKICHYYLKGFCKHGSSCRFFHGHPMAMFSNEFLNDENIFSPGSLEILERELTELLKSRRGFPVSIASLPMLYYEKYGRTLQAEGYLTESQRHGKAGYSLTKLLARLKNSIRLINRPHGQHSVILAEDVAKYVEFTGERSDHGGIIFSSRQIYLTFPAESTFSEQDVSHYFNKFGPVQDVRIPCQQKRMYGFVTFIFPETVRQILAKGNPHYVCGARVLVKPYREKSRLVDRKYAEELQHPVYSAPQFADSDLELPSMARACENSRFLGKQVMVEHALEFERKKLSNLHLSLNNIKHPQLFNFSNEETKLSEEPVEEIEFPNIEDFSYLLEVLNSGSNTDEPESSQGPDLPNRPFTPPIGTSIKTLT